MRYEYIRIINYYETDRMGVVHHSNYIRFLEEARCQWLRNVGMSYEKTEECGIAIPVLSVNCDYKAHVTFGDIISIKPFVKEYNGARLTIGYEITEKESGKIILTGETKHCFTNRELRPINLKKNNKEFSDIYEKLLLDEND